MNWQPTNELRFVERRVGFSSGAAYIDKVLQQRWVSVFDGIVSTEWRDVPVVQE
jgi:hypothetical protein